jgi:HlyD family secretion protein
MAEPRQIFRAAALKRLSSPERLNELVKVTSPKSWLAIAAIWGLLIAALIWGIFGEIPKKVHGGGIIIQSGGIVDVNSVASGKLVRFLHKQGDVVKKGEIIAILAQPELEVMIKNEEAHLKEVRNRLKKVSGIESKENAMKRELATRQQSILEQAIKSKREQISFLKEQIENQEQLVKEGLLTKEVLQNTRQRLSNSQTDIDQYANDLKNVNLSLFESSANKELQINSIEANILEVERRIEELKAKLKIESEIRSEFDGRIIELRANIGEVIRPGSPLVSMEVMASDEKAATLDAIVYVSPAEGKNVKVGMPVKIAPSTVEVEEWGYIEGKVSSVSEYPATPEGMYRVLGNKELVNNFLKGTPPIAVQITLLSDSTTFSKFKWTSVKGPEVEIKSGTLCQADIIIETQKPIVLLFPALKRVK